MKHMGLLAAFVTSAAAVPSFAMPVIGDLEQGTDFETPACVVSNEAEKTLFAVPYQQMAMMKLNGRIVRFQLVRGQKDLWSYTRRNERIDTRYRAGNYEIRIKGRVTDTCEEGEGDCEANEMSLSAQFKEGRRARNLNRLSGSCGV